MRTTKEKLQMPRIPGIERYTMKEAIDMIKNNAKTNIILISHMENLTLEQKLYLAYFYGTREGLPTILDFQKDEGCVTWGNRSGETEEAEDD